MCKPPASCFQVVLGVTPGRYSTISSDCPRTVTRVAAVDRTERSAMVFGSPSFHGLIFVRKAKTVLEPALLVNQMSFSLVITHGRTFLMASPFTKFQSAISRSRD